MGLTALQAFNSVPPMQLRTAAGQCRLCEGDYAGAGGPTVEKQFVTAGRSRLQVALTKRGDPDIPVSGAKGQYRGL